MDPKELYETLSAVHHALPETLQEEFAELAGRLSVASVALERRHQTFGTVQRWRRDHGYGDWR